MRRSIDKWDRDSDRCPEDLARHADITGRAGSDARFDLWMDSMPYCCM